MKPSSSSPVTSFLLSATLFLACQQQQIQVNAGQIKLCAKTEHGNNEPISGANVKCWDDDYGSDDFMASGTTGADGCVTLNYSNRSTSGWKCWKWWDSCSSKHPDIYCDVSGDCLQPKKTSTKNNHNQNYLANFGNVYLEEDSEFCGDQTWNGCGPEFLPDWLTDIADDVSGFEDQCNSHDVCYGIICDRKRSECESAFKSGMYEECDGDYLCEFLADIFYTGTSSSLGADICVDSRDHCTESQRQLCYQ
jgi:hypothetical protein